MLWAGSPVDTAYAKEIADFRAHREAEINSEDGWITVVGLHWLKPGENRVGSDPSFEVTIAGFGAQASRHNHLSKVAR